jgi:hypothetical protein
MLTNNLYNNTNQMYVISVMECCYFVRLMDWRGKQKQKSEHRQDNAHVVLSMKHGHRHRTQYKH